MLSISSSDRPLFAVMVTGLTDRIVASDVQAAQQAAAQGTTHTASWLATAVREQHGQIERALVRHDEIRETVPVEVPQPHIPGNTGAEGLAGVGEGAGTVVEPHPVALSGKEIGEHHVPPPGFVVVGVTGIRRLHIGPGAFHAISPSSSERATSPSLHGAIAFPSARIIPRPFFEPAR